MVDAFLFPLLPGLNHRLQSLLFQKAPQTLLPEIIATQLPAVK